MKVFYIPKCVLGEFFYDPASHQGVAITEYGFMVIGMKEEYDPCIHPGCQELEVNESVFTQLKNSALMYESAQLGLHEALSHFPENKDRVLPNRRISLSEAGAVEGCGA